VTAATQALVRGWRTVANEQWWVGVRALLPASGGMAIRPRAGRRLPIQHRGINGDGVAPLASDLIRFFMDANLDSILMCT